MLTMEGCRVRQQRFRARLEAAGIDGALISAPRDIYYLTGLLAEDRHAPFPSLLYVATEGGSWLATWKAEGEALVEERLSYEYHVLYTMNPDTTARLAALVEARAPSPRGIRRLGYQREALPLALGRT